MDSYRSPSTKHNNNTSNPFLLFLASKFEKRGERGGGQSASPDSNQHHFTAVKIRPSSTGDQRIKQEIIPLLPLIFLIRNHLTCNSNNNNNKSKYPRLGCDLQTQSN